MSRSLCIPTPQQISTPAPLSVVYKLDKNALSPLIQVITKDMKRTGPSAEPWRAPVMPGCPLGADPFTPTQPVFKPVKCIPIPSICREFLQENAVGDSVRCLTRVQADTSAAFPSSTRQITLGAGEQVGRAGAAFPNPLLAGADPLVVPSVLCDVTAP